LKLKKSPKKFSNGPLKAYFGHKNITLKISLDLNNKNATDEPQILVNPAVRTKVMCNWKVSKVKRQEKLRSVADSGIK